MDGATFEIFPTLQKCSDFNENGLNQIGHFDRTSHTKNSLLCLQRHLAVVLAGQRSTLVCSHTTVCKLNFYHIQFNISQYFKWT